MSNVQVIKNPSVEIRDLHVPLLDDIANIIERGLKENFVHARVQVVDCPDLTREPFYLAAPGLCGDPCLVDLGGVPYLIPNVQRDRVYDLADIPALIGKKDRTLMIGAGAGPWFHVGTNCELMANLSVIGKGKCENQLSRLATVNKMNLRRQHEIPPSETRCALLCNLLATNGHHGKVLMVECSERKGSGNFINCMRKALDSHYPNEAIGMGGTFIIDNGIARLHIMPDFSSCDLASDEDVNRWLHYYNANGPLIALSVFLSHDPGLDLRMEHTHCFSMHGEGGHYHEDVTPETVKYYGYFVPAVKIYRIDRPHTTHMVGRD